MSIDRIQKNKRVHKTLITYATMTGSTAEVAQAIGEVLVKDKLQVEVLPMNKVADLADYDAVILGAPMIMGWHRAALSFLRSHQLEIEHRPIAIFALAMNLTSTDDTSVGGVPVCVDQSLVKSPVNSSHLSLKERYTNLTHYVNPIIKAAGPAHPVSLAIFGGRLEYFRLNIFAKLFVMLIVHAQPGDLRNWQAIRSWAATLPGLFLKNGMGF